MKSIFLKSISVVILVFSQIACHKTYTCQCSYTSSGVTSGPYTTGQVKAMSKPKALKRCSGSCSGGDVSVK